MTNYSFTEISSEEKKKNLSEVLSKRCRGLIKQDVIESIIARLDHNRQMKIEVVNESVMKQQAKRKTTVHITDSHVSEVDIQWVRCLIGSIEFGEDLTFIEDGSENIKKSSQSIVKSNPLIVQLDEQSLGEMDSSFTRLLVML